MVVFDNDNDTSPEGPPSADQPAAGHNPGPKLGLVDSERLPEELQERDRFATCWLEPAPGRQLAAGPLGRLDFWQADQNRGLLHLLARVRFELPLERSRRESFQLPVERAPANGSEFVPPAARLRHQIWLISSPGDAGSCANISGQLAGGSLLAELKSEPTGGRTVDLDVELAVARFNLGEPNSIIGKCLLLTRTGGPDGSSAGPIGGCRVAESAVLPPTAELDLPPSVSQVQPVPEALLEVAKVRANGTDELKPL